MQAAVEGDCAAVRRCHQESPQAVTAARTEVYAANTRRCFDVVVVVYGCMRRLMCFTF